MEDKVEKSWMERKEEEERRRGQKRVGNIEKSWSRMEYMHEEMSGKGKKRENMRQNVQQSME